MVKIGLGIFLVLVSIMFVILFILKGLMFPHLLGPILLGIVGAVLLIKLKK